MSAWAVFPALTEPALLLELCAVVAMESWLCLPPPDSPGPPPALAPGSLLLDLDGMPTRSRSWNSPLEKIWVSRLSSLRFFARGLLDLIASLSELCACLSVCCFIFFLLDAPSVLLCETAIAAELRLGDQLKQQLSKAETATLHAKEEHEQALLLANEAAHQKLAAEMAALEATHSGALSALKGEHRLVQRRTVWRS